MDGYFEIGIGFWKDTFKMNGLVDFLIIGFLNGFQKKFHVKFAI